MQRTVILGAGESGVGAAMLAKKLGHNVFVSDKGDIKEKYRKELQQMGVQWEEKQHSESNIMNADIIVKSPGIPDDSPLIKKITYRGIPLISEIEFAGRHTQAKIIAITGTNGKTTTSHLTYHLFKQAGAKVALAGNVGTSFARQLATEDMDYYVIEISSFQLDGIVHFRPDVAVMLNITEDHLDRYHHSFSEYIASKFRVTMNQTADDYFIYCADDTITVENTDKFNIKAKKIPFTIKKKVCRKALLSKTINYSLTWEKNNLKCQF